MNRKIPRGVKLVLQSSCCYQLLRPSGLSRSTRQAILRRKSSLERCDGLLSCIAKTTQGIAGSSTAALQQQQQQQQVCEDGLDVFQQQRCDYGLWWRYLMFKWQGLNVFHLLCLFNLALLPCGCGCGCCCCMLEGWVRDFFGGDVL